MNSTLTLWVLLAFNYHKGLLKGGPDSHVDLVDKLQKNYKTNTKALTNVSREMATKEVIMVVKRRL